MGRVCAGHDVKLRLSTRRSGWSSGLWFLLLLLARPVTLNTTVSPEATTNTTTAATETSATSSNISTTIPATALTTELYSTDNQTTETTPYPSTGNTTSSETTPYPSTENTTSSETTPYPSTENTTSSETTPYPSTENTTSSETTTNSTAFTETAEPSSSASTNDTTALTQSPAPSGTAPTVCNVSQSCLNAFYWMTVEVTGTSQSEQNIKTQLEELFKNKLNVCKEADPTSQSSSTDTPVLYTSPSPVSGNLSLFEALELTCDSTNITEPSLCNVLLKLSAPVDVCCVRNTVMDSSVIVRVLGLIRRVGVCGDNMTRISAGQYDKCNQSVKLEECGTASLNISCGNRTNVMFPFDTGAAEDCPRTPCNCSSHCDGSDFYYYSNITLIGVAEGHELISTLLKDWACQNTSSVCNITQTFIRHIRDWNVTCEREVCSVIVQLDTDMDVCNITTAIISILESQKNVSFFVGVVSRLAICYNTSYPLQQKLRWQPSLSRNFSSEDFCTDPNRENFAGFCSEGSTVIPLDGRCNDSTTPFQNTTTSPPSLSNTTSTNSTNSNSTNSNSTNSTNSNSTNSNSTNSNSTNSTTATPASASGNGTTSPANATTAGPVDADGLLSLSANASSLNASQVERLVLQLEALLSGPNVSLAVANTSIKIVNNLLDVPVAVISPFSKRVIGIVDAVGLKLVVSETSQSILSQSLALAVKKVNGTQFQETSFSIIDSSNLQIRSSPGPETEDVAVRVVSSPLGSVVLPASLTQNLTTDQQRLASRVQFNFFQKDTFFQDASLGGRKLNSGIVGSSVSNLSVSGLQKEVLITLRNTEPIPANYAATCVFWDFSFNGGAGGWSGSGCRVLNSSAEETQCACNHLTSFGILLDISKTSIPPEHLNILTYITYIGCGVSAIFLSATLLTYLAFGKLRKDIPSKILIQLCVALLLLNLVFLLDAWLALFPDAVGLCISTGFFLHYFLLASFTWMALEAVHMYLALVKVFNTYISRFMVKIGLAGWGIPLIIVIIVIAVNKDNYGLVTYGRYADGTTDDFCWIINDTVFYVAVVAYLCVVFLVNFTMFIVVMIQLCRIKKQNPHNVQNRSGWQELRSVAGLTVLLGLTWGFAFFAWGPVHLAFMYLFAIFNTLQGFFIFVFHCAMKENVRRQWRTYLCCGRLRLSENSEWSRTATQKIHKASKEKTSFHSSNSNNSSLSFLNHDSLACDVPMGVCNPMDDRIMRAAEEPIPGSDVVLNEINDQYRGQRSY